ncbi:hypothetical protein [Pedobacter gandavensis]|uniref:hypothetical protein n=1 Tax=Pedobacter gandavensis TaxID=2679963 RepID=UPI002930A028|nr:hypothetical protein [Pedobacter gandavensis]
MEKYNGTIQFIAILIALLLPMVLTVKLFYILKTKEYSLINLVTCIVYLALITVAYLFLNNAQRLFLAIYLGLITVVFVIVFIIKQLLEKLFKK